jgi:NAD(P)-dependent dehydrogenase (short-subunit alcohol dehydrogenase family)
VNVRGLYFQLQSLLPLLGNPSSVVFTSSIAGSIAFAGTSIYSATKAAVISLGKTLAVELAPRGIRVNSKLVCHVAAKMFLQTFGDVTVLGESRLIESFALPVKNKSLAELLDL